MRGKMTKLNFFNGLREIGGTFIEVETDKAKCMFDFGFAVADRLDKNVRVRKHCYAADYVTLGMLTPADGIYDKKTADKLNLKAYGETDKECFFVISHMHIDHMGGLGMLDERVPVYMSRDSLRLYRRLEACNDIQEGAHKNCIGIDFGDSFTVGDITVKVLPIDHDVVGASGFLITTPDGSVCYTGDYRFHGFHPEVTENFAKAVAGVDVMITEGVSVSFADVDMVALETPTEEMKAEEWTEERLQTEMAERAEELEGLLVINPYNRNVERLHRLIETFKKAGRTLVLDAVAADYVAEFYPQDEICVFKESLHEGEADESAVRSEWKIIDRQMLLENPKQYVLQLDYRDMNELIDLQKAASAYFHMDGSPLGDYDPSYNKMKAFLEAMEIPYEYKGTGGHARPYYLRYMIDTIAPKTLIPLHSFRPEQVMSEKAGARFLPEYGESFILS